MRSRDAELAELMLECDDHRARTGEIKRAFGIIRNFFLYKRSVDESDVGMRGWGAFVDRVDGLDAELCAATFEYFSVCDIFSRPIGIEERCGARVAVTFFGIKHRSDHAYKWRNADTAGDKDDFTILILRQSKISVEARDTHFVAGLELRKRLFKRTRRLVEFHAQSNVGICRRRSDREIPAITARIRFLVWECPFDVLARLKAQRSISCEYEFRRTRACFLYTLECEHEADLGTYGVREYIAQD